MGSSVTVSPRASNDDDGAETETPTLSDDERVERNANQMNALAGLFSFFGGGGGGKAESVSCAWTCPNGAEPTAIEGFVKRFNGCGLEGMGNIDLSGGLYNMTECCNEHDRCYDTCNSG